jgi:hypothetical protein
MRLDEQNPGQGYAAAALSVVERGRARSLLELLGESGAEIRRDADPALLDRERELARLIAGKAEPRVNTAKPMRRRSARNSIRSPRSWTRCEAGFGTRARNTPS